MTAITEERQQPETTTMPSLETRMAVLETKMQFVIDGLRDNGRRIDGLSWIILGSAFATILTILGALITLLARVGGP